MPEMVKSFHHNWLQLLHFQRICSLSALCGLGRGLEHLKHRPEVLKLNKSRYN